MKAKIVVHTFLLYADKLSEKRILLQGSSSTLLALKVVSFPSPCMLSLKDFSAALPKVSRWKITCSLVLGILNFRAGQHPGPLPYSVSTPKHLYSVTDRSDSAPGFRNRSGFVGLGFRMVKRPKEVRKEMRLESG